MANSNAKLQEGLQHIKEAEHALKTGFFKWKEDYDTAADRYGKAALCFKLAKALDRSKSAYIKASQAHVKNHALFHGAKSLVEAASIATTLEDIDEALDLMKQAAKLYREYGLPDSAASTLVKASKMCQALKPEKAVELLESAADLCEVDEKLREAGNHLNSAIRIQLKNEKYFEACDTLDKFIQLNSQAGSYSHVHKGILIKVIVHLTVDDSVAADRLIKTGYNYQGFVDSEEGDVCEKLVNAYDDGDGEELQRLSRLAVISMQDVEVAKLGRALKPSEMSINIKSKEAGPVPLTLESLGGAVTEVESALKEPEVNAANKEPEVEAPPKETVTIEEEDLDEGIC